MFNLEKLESRMFPIIFEELGWGDSGLAIGTSQNRGNLGLAELHGPKHDLYLLGARLRGFTSISPLYSGCGLMFSASSYGDTLGLTFTSDRNMMPNPIKMRECLDRAVQDVEDHLRTKKKRKVTA